MASQHLEVEISQIKIGQRYRKELGDVEGLASSIEEMGLLQAIGLDAEFNLIFGERRIRAFQSLGRSKIPVRIVEVPSIIQGEYAENEVRKDFNASERAAIGKSIEERLGERRGKDNVENFPHLKGQKTRDIAAKKAGFGNGKTFDQAKAVVEHGVPELVEAMDNKVVSISAAAKIAAKPAEEQRTLMELPTPIQARKQAQETSRIVLARDGRLYDSKPIEQERAEVRISELYDNVSYAMEQIAKIKITPSRYIEIMPNWLRSDLDIHIKKSGPWLLEFMKLWSNRA